MCISAVFVYGRSSSRFWEKVVSQARAKRYEAKSFGRKLDEQKIVYFRLGRKRAFRLRSDSRPVFAASHSLLGYDDYVANAHQQRALSLHVREFKIHTPSVAFSVLVVVSTQAAAPANWGKRMDEKARSRHVAY